MAIRFTEYLRYKDREIPLYIVQEDIDEDKVGFKIFVKNEANTVFALYKSGGEPWQLIPHVVPQIVQDIQKQLISLLEDQLVKTQRFEPLTRRFK